MSLTVTILSEVIPAGTRSVAHPAKQRSGIAVEMAFRLSHAIRSNGREHFRDRAISRKDWEADGLRPLEWKWRRGGAKVIASRTQSR
jgi:hypothetical protein